jgi:magnesium transporter
MDVHWISAGGVEQQHVDALPALLTRTDGFVWVDIPGCDEPATRVLEQVFGFHPLAVQDCQGSHPEAPRLP